MEQMQLRIHQSQVKPCSSRLWWDQLIPSRLYFFFEKVVSRNEVQIGGNLHLNDISFANIWDPHLQAN